MLPSSVEFVGYHAFSYCNNLVTVSYRGSSDPHIFNEVEYMEDDDIEEEEDDDDDHDDDFDDKIGYDDNVFYGCDQLYKLCVPGYYNDALFFDRYSYCWSNLESCEDVILKGDHCSTEVCLHGEINHLQEERKNASEWEEKSNACVSYICDKQKGPISEINCFARNGERFMCSNDGRLRVDEWVLRVELEIEGIAIGIDNVSEV